MQIKVAMPMLSRLFKRSLVISEKVGHDHPDVAMVMSNLAKLYLDHGRYADAEPLYKRALAIHRSAPCHPPLPALDGKTLAMPRISRAQDILPRKSAVVAQVPSLDQFNRIVVKVGSSLLVDFARGAVKQAWLEALVEDVAALHRRGANVLVVSSGAIALGRTVAGLPKGALKLEDSQASAAIGQIALASAWSQALHSHGIVAGQVLVTLQDTEERRRYLNARATLGRLIAMRAIPVINENDTVATSEIRYGDNDRLAARVATMASADLLILLSDVAGLYDAPPSAMRTQSSCRSSRG